MNLFGSRVRGRGPRRTAQSLVEFALMLPVLLVILAGGLEVANVLQVYNQLNQAVREAARFGASGGSNGGIVDVMTVSLNYDESNTTGLSVWVVRPVLNVINSTTYGWEGQTVPLPWGIAPECAFPDSGVCSDAMQVPAAMMASAIRTGSGTITDAAVRDSIDGERYVIVEVTYWAQTLLNLPFWQVPGQASGLVPLRVHAVMRQEVEQEAVQALEEACLAYPLALHADAVSNYGNSIADSDIREGERWAVTDNTTTNPTNPGFVYLAWNVGYSTNDVDLALDNFQQGGASQDFNEYFPPVEPDPDDGLHVLDWVVTSPGVPPNAGTTIAEHESLGRQLRIIYYSTVDPAHGSPTRTAIQIDGFAIVKIVGSSTGSSITFQLVRVDKTCGQDL